MKISILLPTRDRLSLLRHAVHSVRRLDDPDWEIVISDNESSEDVEGYVDSLADPRVRYVRTPTLLPVAENWNNALLHSSGDYVVMLGDDDALLGNYFTRTRRLIAEFDHPQVIYHNALCYAYPGVLPEEPEGFLRSEGYARFLHGAERPFRLPAREARSLVAGAMDFRLRYGFNMQFVTIGRELIEQLSRGGPFFRSPFPDYFAMNNAFLRASSIVVEPHPLVVIGVSPRSYGFFHNNRRESEGRSFLEGNGTQGGAPGPESPLLPGTNINDGWLRAMEALHEELGSPSEPRPNYRRYRRLQVVHVYYAHFLQGGVAERELAELGRHLSRRERLLYGALFSVLRLLARVLPARALPYFRSAVAMSPRQFPWWDPVRDPGRMADISEVVERIDGDQEPGRWERQRGSRLRAALLGRILPG
jgi:glycosyltransferase involved in cell wall biosynthesis